MAASAPAASALPPLVAVTNKVSPNREYMYCQTNNTGVGQNENLFLSNSGGLLFR